MNPDRNPTAPVEAGINPDRAFLLELWNRRTPFTYLFFALNILIFLLMELSGGTTNEATLLAFGVKSNAAIEAGEFWRFLTPVFIHIGLLHLAFNSYALWIVGQQVERLYGSARFVLLYVLMGIAGAASSFLYHPRSLSAGASGAIFGLFGVLLIFGIRHRRTIPAFFRRALRAGILPIIVINLLIGFSIPAIDNAAHIGGLAAGIVLAAFVGFKPPGERTPGAYRLAQIGAIGAILFAFVQVGIHYDGPSPSLRNLGRGWVSTLTGRSATQQFIDTMNSAQEAFPASRRLLRREPGDRDYDEITSGLASSIDQLRDLPSLSSAADELVAELLEVMDEQYAIIQDVRRGASAGSSQMRRLESNSERYRRTVRALFDWVETEGGRYGLEIRSPGGEGELPGP